MRTRVCIFLLLLCVFFPALVRAQQTKKKVASAADLPRFSYDVPGKLTDLLTNDAAYKSFAAKVRADLEGVLQDYEIEDRSTVKEIQSTLAELDLQEGKLDAAVERFRIVRDLEEKPDLQYLPTFFDTQIIAKAQLRSGSSSGEKYLKSLRLVLAETLEAMPDSVLPGIKEYRFGYDMFNENFVTGLVNSRFAAVAQKNGNKLFSEQAFQMIGLRTLLQHVVPVVGEFAKSFDTYIAARKSAPKINIWTNRAVDLKGKAGLTPVIVAVWDTGVDATLFPGQMFVNRGEKLDGKDNDSNGLADDINGIGFDVMGKYTPEPMLSVRADDLKRYAEWTSERRVMAKLQDAVDDEETRALKQKLQAETAAEAAESLRRYDVLGHYAHGTQVASVVADGNPAVRILNARRTWRNESGQNDSVPQTVEYARRFERNIKTYVDYFKKQQARVVNMSWSLSRKDVEENLAKNAPRMTAEQRRIEADKSFEIIKNALAEAFKSAPDILFVCSAGNANNDAGFNEAIPSALGLPNLITVGAVDERGGAATFTSFGKNIGLYAQGVNVPARVPGGATLPFIGTSAAAPGVANLAAKLLAINSKLKVAEVVKLIQDNADVSEADKRLKLINPKRTVKALEARKSR